MRNLTEGQQAGLMLVVAVILGSWLRLTPALLAGFPINDGGMFYTMIADLSRNGYALPAFTSYNGANIPFAYPPLGFYVAGILTTSFHISIIHILQWLPALISILVIPAFYLLASELLKTRISAALATLIFSFSSRAMSWFIMGGGLTRVFGQLFMLLTLYSAQRLFKTASRKNLFLTILFGALTVLSHPEAAIQTAGAAFLLWLITARNKAALLNGLKVSVAVIALTSVWWGTILYQHGAAPLFNAGQTGNSGLILALIPFYFTDEPYMTVISVLGIVGLFASLGRKEYFLPLWVLEAFMIDPRSAAWVANFSLAMLAAVLLAEIIVPSLSAPVASQPGALETHARLISQIMIGYILAYVLLNTYTSNIALSDIHLGDDYKTAMLWVKENTPLNSRFILLIPGTDFPMRDPVQEWFPALAERSSLTTMQGQEWVLGANFTSVAGAYRNLQACPLQDIDCLNHQPILSGATFDYIYLSKSTNGWPCASAANCQGADKFIQSAQDTGRFKLVYENSSVVVLKAEN